MTNAAGQLEALTLSFEQAWNAMDFNALAELWDQSEPEIYYVAEEVDKPLHRFADLQDYWERTSRTVESVRVYLSDKRFRLLSDDLATVTFEMHVDASMRGFRQQGFKPVGTDVRVSAILRRTGSDWKFIHYAEAAIGALPFIRRVYNANVRSG